MHRLIILAYRHTSSFIVVRNPINAYFKPFVYNHEHRGSSTFYAVTSFHLAFHRLENRSSKCYDIPIEVMGLQLTGYFGNGYGAMVVLSRDG